MVTAAEVKALRERTGLPMMDCKKALAEANGDQEEAIRLLRERGAQVMSKRADRATDFGRFGLHFSFDPPVGAIVELRCESAPVVQSESFVQLADDLARQLATGPGASTAEELLDQPSPSQPDRTLREQKDELFNRIREVFNVGRLARFEGACGGYLHPGARVHGVLVEVEGGDPATVKDICMHIAAMNPAALTTDDLDPDEVAKEREILREAALQEGKPEKIVDKMVEGRLRNYFAERVLNEQPFVKDDKVTVGRFAAAQGMKLKRFVHWVVGED